MNWGGRLFPWIEIWLPALTIGVLAVGIYVRGRLSLPLVAIGLLGPFAAFAYGILDSRSYEHGRDIDFWVAASAVWAAVNSVLLIVGYLLNRRGRGAGQALSLIGLTGSAISWVLLVLYVLFVVFSGGQN